MLGAFASGWNIIVRKKTLEDHNYSLRQVMNFPGMAPFRHVKRVDKEVWVMERNPDYWNEGLPYLDGLEFYHLAPFTPELAAARSVAKSITPAPWIPCRPRKCRAPPECPARPSTRASFKPCG